MKKVKRRTVFCFLFIITLFVVSPCQMVNAGGTVAKDSSSEWYNENGHSGPSIRWKRTYGLLAKNVKSVKVAMSLSMNSSAIYISQREGEWRNIDFSEKYIRIDKNGILYKNDLVAGQVSDFYPVGVEILFMKKGGKELLYTGYGEDIDFLPLPKQSKYRDLCEFPVLENVGDCWYGEWMLACIKDGALHIDAPGEETLYKKKLFKGKINQIRKVVSCTNYGPDGDGYQSTFFVLMKNGTVWGMGYNNRHLISNEDKKYYSKFVKLKVKNVKDICAARKNVGILKKDGSLWVWGQKRSGKDGRNKKFTVIPWRIDNGVQSFSMSPSGDHNCILLFVKNGKAYGWGSARRFALPKKSKNNWHNDRPVFLKSNIKQVYAAESVTLLLDNGGNLYWRGSAANPINSRWIEKNLEKKRNN